MIHRVHFRNENVTVHVADDSNLRRVCLDNDVDPYPLLGGKLSCHGKGFCGTCLVGVDDEQKLTPPTKREARWLKKHKPGPGRRLSCQVAVKGDLIVTTHPGDKTGWHVHNYYSGRVDRPWEDVRKSTLAPAPSPAPGS